MAENDSSSDIVQNNYTPSASAIEKANSVVTSNDDTIQKVSSNADLLLSDSNSNVLSVLNDMERQQSANRINDTRQLNKIIDILDSKGEAPLRNRYHEMTEMLETISTLKSEIQKSNNQKALNNETMMDDSSPLNVGGEIIQQERAEEENIKAASDVISNEKETLVTENNFGAESATLTALSSDSENNSSNSSSVIETDRRKEEAEKLKASFSENNVKTSNSIESDKINTENEKTVLNNLASEKTSKEILAAEEDANKNFNNEETTLKMLSSEETSKEMLDNLASEKTVKDLLRVEENHNNEETLKRLDEDGEEVSEDSLDVSSTRQEMLDELRKLNENAEGIGTNIESGFKASMDEAEKRATLEKKIAEIKEQRDKENENVLLRKISNGSVEVGEAVESGLSEAVSGMTKAVGFAMGDNDKKLLASIMMGVTAFKASIDGFKKMRERWQKGGKWLKGLGKNSQGEEGSSLEEKTLAAYEDQLAQVKASHEALVGIGGNLNLEGEETYQRLMAELTEDIEKDLTELIKIFNEGPTKDGTTDELINDMTEVAACCQDVGIDDIESAVITPTELLEEISDQNKELVGYNNELVEHNEDTEKANKKKAEKEDNKKDKAKLSTDEKDEKKNKLKDSYAKAQAGNDKDKKDGMGGMLSGLRGMKGIVDIIRGVSKAFNVLKTVFNVIRTVVMGVGAALAAVGGFIFSWVGAIIAAIVAVGAAIWYFWDDIVGFWDDLTEWFSDGWDSLVKGWNDFWADPFGPLRDAWSGFTGWITDTIDKMIWKATNWFGSDEDYEEHKKQKDEERAIADLKEKEDEAREARTEAKEKAAEAAMERQEAAEEAREIRLIAEKEAEEERLAKEERIDERNREKWAEENPEEARSDFWSLGDPNYEKYKEEQRLKEEAEDAASDAEWEELSKPTPDFQTKPKAELYTDKDFETWPGYEPFMKKHNSFARVLIGTKKNEEKAKSQELMDKEIQKFDDKHGDSPYNFNILKTVRDESEKARMEKSSKTKLGRNANLAIDNLFDDDGNNDVKAANELYTEQEIENAPYPEVKNNMEAHNSKARLMVDPAQKQRQRRSANMGDGTGSMLLRPDEQSNQKVTGFDLMSILSDQDKKEADSSKNESASVNIQNNNSTSNVNNNSSGGGNKTYIYSGIVPTAPSGGVIIGATD